MVGMLTEQAHCLTPGGSTVNIVDWISVTVNIPLEGPTNILHHIWPFLKTTSSNDWKDRSDKRLN